MNVSEQIAISSTPSEIFSYLMNIENRKNFIPALDEIILLDPLPFKKGSRYIEVAKIGGRQVKTTYQITDYKENAYVIAKTIKSLFPILAKSTVIETNEGTILRFDLEFTLKGIFKLASGIVQGIVSQQTIGILKNVKKNLEKQN